MKLLQGLTIFLVTCLALTNAGYRRMFRTNKPVTLVPTKAPLFPSDMPPDALKHLKVPSAEFCNKMDIQPAHHYIVLPWWYHYCQNMKEGTFKKGDEKLLHLDRYKSMLAKVQQYQKQYGIDRSNARRRLAAHVKRL